MDWNLTLFSYDRAALTDRKAAERRLMFAEKIQNHSFGAGYTARKAKAASGADAFDASYDEVMRLYQVKKDSRDSGDMEGYRQILQTYESMRNDLLKPNVLETENGQIQAEYKAGELTSGILGLGVCGNGLYSLRYAQNSTAENPVVEVRVENHQGTGKNTYFVDIHSVDVENASEMELFALLAHYEKQGMTSGGVRLYEQGRAAGIFQAENLMEFLYEKQNWAERFEQFSDSEIGMILQEFLQMIEESGEENKKDSSE